MPVPYPIASLPVAFVDHQALQNLADFCNRPGHRVALVGFNECAKHLVNLCGDQIIGFYDPDERKVGISFRGKRVVGVAEKLDITHIAVTDYRLLYDFSAEVSSLYGDRLPVHIPPRLDQKATSKIDAFSQERFYQGILAHAADAPISMLGQEKICFLMEMLRYALRLPGDVIEMGVWQGGGAWYLAKVLAAAGSDRTLLLVDLFETLTNNRNATMCNDEIQRSLDFFPHVEMHVGLVNDRQLLGRMAGRTYCFAHYDLGYHEEALQHVWERMSPGAPLILDNYGHLAVAPKKFERFFAAYDARVIRLPWSDHAFVLKA